MRNCGIREHKQLLESKSAKEIVVEFGYKNFQKNKKLLSKAVVFGKDFLETVSKINPNPSLFLIHVKEGSTEVTIEDLTSGLKGSVTAITNKLPQNAEILFNSFALYDLKLSPTTFTKKSMLAFIYNEQKRMYEIVVFLARRSFVCVIKKGAQ